MSHFRKILATYIINKNIVYLENWILKHLYKAFLSQCIGEYFANPIHHQNPRCNSWMLWKPSSRLKFRSTKTEKPMYKHDFQLNGILERQNYGDSEKTSVCRWLRGKEGDTRQRVRVQGIFRAVKLSEWYNGHLIHLSKPIEFTTQRVSPNENCGLYLIVIYQHWLFSDNWCPSPVQERSIEKAVVGIRKEVGVLLLSVQFFCKAETALNNKSQLIKD